MKITRITTTEIEIDENSYNVGRINLEELLGKLRTGAPGGVDLAASEDQPYQLREVTPELLVEVLEEAGADVEVTRNPETNEIDEIHASANLPLFDHEPSREQILDSLRASATARLPFILLGGTKGILDSIQATGPTPSKILGDLAQTSVSTGDPATETQVIGLAEWTLSWKRKTADATTTDDDTYESSLGSTASWSVKAKYMFIDGDTSQSTYILATITAPQSPMTWNFFPTIGTGRAAFQGQAYVDGIDIATGMGKVVGLDVSLKGTGKLNFLAQIAEVANPNTGTGEQAEV